MHFHSTTEPIKQEFSVSEVLNFLTYTTKKGHSMGSGRQQARPEDKNVSFIKEWGENIWRESNQSNFRVVNFIYLLGYVRIYRGI